MIDLSGNDVSVAADDMNKSVSAAESRSASRVSGAVGGASSSIAATYGDISAMSSTIASESLYVGGIAAKVGLMSASPDLLASMVLSPLTGAAAVDGLLTGATQLAAHVVIADALALVTGSIVSTYEMADSALSIAAAGIVSTGDVAGAVVVGTGNELWAAGKMAAGGVYAAALTAALLPMAVDSITAGIIKAGIPALEVGLLHSAEDVLHDPKTLFNGQAGADLLVRTIKAFPTANFWTDTVTSMQAELGLFGPAYPTVIGGLIASGNAWGLFKDGSATVDRTGVVDPRLTTLLGAGSAKSSAAAIYGKGTWSVDPKTGAQTYTGIDGTLTLDANGQVVPHDVSSLMASASQIDARGDNEQADIRIIKVDDGNGSFHYTVQIPSTQSWSPVAGSTPNDLTSDLAAMSHGDQTALADSVYTAMAKAGITSKDPVMLVGFSLGGITAGSMAAGGSHFDIQQVVTAGSPIGAMNIPSSTHVLSLEANQDPVAILDGRMNPSTPTWTTLRGDAVPKADQSASTTASSATAHDSNRYGRMAVDNPAVNSTAGVQSFLPTNGQKVTVTDYYATRK